MRDCNTRSRLIALYCISPHHGERCGRNLSVLEQKLNCVLRKVVLSTKKYDDDDDDDGDKLYFSVRSSSWPCKAY